MSGNGGPPAPQPLSTSAQTELMPGELVRIYVGPGQQIMFQYRADLADARGWVASVLAAIDRQLLVRELLAALRSEHAEAKDHTARS